MIKIENLMAADWAAAFREIDPEIDEKLSKIDEFLKKERENGERVLPEPENIFRAFSRNLAETKVLIVGQDPYPNPEYPMGLAFSVDSNITKIPMSLRNIFREIYEDINENPQFFTNNDKITDLDEVKTTTFREIKNGDLTQWSEQNIMLLNRVLTVRAWQTNSHLNKGWEEITDTAIKILAYREEIFSRKSMQNFANNFHKDQPLVVILWGNNARVFAPIFKKRENILVIESSHPSPMSARRGFFGSRPFSKTNEFLISRNVKPIDWKIREK